MYIPQTDDQLYPEHTGNHYGSFKMNRGIVFDKDYPYVDNSKGFAFKRFWVRLLCRIIVFPFMVPPKTGLKVKGKKNIRKHKKELKDGFINVSNHIHDWDYLCIMKAIHNFKWPYVMSIGENINNDSGPLVRFVGGIPIPPKNDDEAKASFNHDILQMLKNGGVLQVYAEGSKWDYYVPIRPFKRGAASYAIKADRPILPMAFSYREPNWFRRVVMKQIACFTLNIGEPIYANKDLTGLEQIDELTTRVHQAVCSLAGFDHNNIYPPIYSEESSLKKTFKN